MTANAEVAELARKAWAAMTFEPNGMARMMAAITKQNPPAPMPAAVAVDMVQDAAADRGSAVVAIIYAAAAELEGLMPTGVIPTGSLTHIADLVVHSLRHRWFQAALDDADRISNTVAFPDPRGGSGLLVWDQWRQWANRARRTIGLCREVFELWD